MARNLPWATAPFPTTKKPSKPRPKQNERDAASTTSNARVEQSLNQNNVTPTRRQRSSRTPSTSPPPGPPHVEPMREGFDEDDAWMMVEDELQILAQTFTAHLHHAEYKRLVRKAKTAPKRQLPEPSSPVSSATTQKLRRKALNQKQSNGLDQIMPRIDESGSDELKDEKIEDPWRGTSLAGLMAAGSQEKRSLKGLEKLPSSTRAARGYQTTANGNFEGSTASQTAEHTKSTKLNRNSLLKPKAPSANVHTKASRHHSQETSTDGVTEPVEPRQGTDGSAGRKRLLKQTSVDVIDDHGEIQSSNVQRQEPLRSFKKKKVKEESKEDRLAEVPMFII